MSVVFSPTPDAATRDRVLREVSHGGPITAGAIAQSLGLTVPGIRRHLDALRAEGTITSTEDARSGSSRGEHAGRRGPGRPARTYVLTSAGHSRLSSEYDDIATAVLRFLAERDGVGAVTEFAQRRASELEQRYASAVMAAGPDPRARAAALADALTADGFAAGTRDIAGAAPRTPPPSGAASQESSRSSGAAGAPSSHDPSESQVSAGVQLCQGHCPMHQVASEFPQFCEAETAAFGRLLGVHVQRLATLAGGEHVCTTHIPVALDTGSGHETHRSATRLKEMAS